MMKRTFLAIVGASRDYVVYPAAACESSPSMTSSRRLVSILAPSKQRGALAALSFKPGATG
jgi:hypothetical protein